VLASCQMAVVLFALFAGVAFILLGRWMYGNPTRVYPNWLPSDPKSHFHARFVRGFATVVIFVGSYAVMAGISEHFLSDWFAISAATMAGIAGAFFLRPRAPSPSQ